MVKITKNERDYLVSCGIRFGENGISHTNSNRKHYYATESRRILELLKQYRSKVSM